MEESTARTDHDEKDNPVSTSPDSGICDLDTQAEDNSKPPSPEVANTPPLRIQPYPEGRFRYTHSYDPFFFKYATDNRKLTLLKSLSQDSEYSLDTSLFDAEEFLQDMGFAGGSDPTIPDRFLPSLIQRLSKFPESEMDSLHHRIVQSIGCFRRKEGKRRLFRNLSMGKDSSVDHFDKNHLPCPSNNYPLLRSNTGPAEFPFNDATTPVSEVNNNSLKSGKFVSSDSGHHSMDSLKSEGEFPESPIAILVSSASVEQEDKSLDENTEKGVQVSMNNELLVDDQSSDSETATQTSDGEFMNTVQEIQNLTDCISNNDNGESFSNETDFASERIEMDCENDPSDTEDSLTVSKSVPSNSMEENSLKTVCEIASEAENLTPFFHSDKSALSKHSPISSQMKRPLRRISNAESYNPLKHSKGFGSLEHQNKINEDDIDFDQSSLYEPNLTAVEASDCNSNNSNNPFKNKENDDCGDNSDLINPSISNCEPFNANTLDSNPFLSNETSFSSAFSTTTDSSPFYSNQKDLSEISCNTFASIECQPEKETRSSTKPKFIRDDSLTNFLSSMLDMSESDSVLKSPVTRFSLMENQSKSDSEVLQDDFSSEKFSVQYNFDKTQSSESLNDTQRFVPFAQNSSPDAKNVPEKSANRKRHVLRRMSSSLQYNDDEIYEDPNKLATTEGFQFSLTNPFVSPKLPLRHTKSGQYDYSSGHRSVHPCNSLPTMKLHGPYKVQNEMSRYANPFSYTKSNSVQSNSNPEAAKSYNRRREKRNCKKRRFLSAADADSYSNFWNRAGPRELSKFNSCDNLCNHQYLPGSLYDCNHDKCYSCSCQEVNHCRIHYDEQYPKWDHYFLKERLTSCMDCNSLNRHSFQPPHCRHARNSEFPTLPVRGSCRRCLWNSTPDVRYGNHNSMFQDCFRNPKLNSLYDHPTDQCENLSRNPSICDDVHFSDDVFFPEKVPYSFAHSGQMKQPDNVKSNSSRKLKVRMPQRQNSMSIDDPYDHPFPNRKNTTHIRNFQNSILNKNGFLSGESSSNTSSPPDGPSRKVSTVALPTNIPGDLQKNLQLRDITANSTQEKQFFDTQMNNSFKKGPPVTNKKNEALLERKIRIFSKFFANLGNLSKSIPDRHSDNEHKEKRDARFYDVIGTDKPRKSSVRSDFKAITSRKCSTPPPEYDRLINLVKTHSSSLESSDEYGTSYGTVKEVKYPIYENRVVLQPVQGIGKKQKHFKPLHFTSAVSMYINPDENKEDSGVNSKDGLKEMDSNRDNLSTKSDDNSRPSSQMSFKVVSKELEDLQQSIRKAKEMRISASKELHLLQELLSGDDNAEAKNESAKEKKFPTIYPVAHLKDSTFRSTEIEEKQALKDLREKSKKEVLEDTSFWQEEIQKVKQETNQAWQEKLDRMEARLTSQEEELHRLQSENENLHKSLEFQRLGSPTCHCRSDSGQNGFGRIDSAFEDDEEYFSHKPSIPIQPTRQECDRLQERLTEEEQKADQLKLLLNQKLIDFNKLQITLSKQTKEMIELEKSYLQLQCRLRKGTSKPVVARLCSRTSPFNSKNLCPKPSPPATPQPNGVS